MEPGAETRVFVEVARAGSFAAAAQQLGLTPSAVSRIVARTEERLGVRLLNRTTRSQTLTEAGSVYLDHAERILLDVDAAESAVRGYATRPTGSLKVAATDAFAIMVLVPFLEGFLSRHDGISVKVAQGDGEVDLVAEGIDVAIRFARPTGASFVSRKIVEDPYVICAAPSYLARFGTPEHPSDLRDHRCLPVFARGRTSDSWIFRRGEEDLNVRVGGPFSGIGLAVRDAAVAGLGITRLASYLVGPEIEAGRLVPLFGDWVQNEERAIHAVYPDRAFLPPKTRVFIDEVSAFVKEELPLRHRAF